MATQQRPLASRTLTSLVFVLAATACGGSPRAGAAVPGGARAGDLRMEPCAYKPGAVEYRADCGSLIVPEKRGAARARLIALPVVRVHASGSSSAEPIFFLDGGPGEALNLRYQPSAALLARHDVVLVGYRGVDGSSVLACPEVDDAMLGVGGDLLSDASRANLGHARTRCAQRLTAAGVDLAGYTLPEVVADLDAARAGLGYARIHLLARGYGTRIAQLYAHQHPDRAARSALVGPGMPGHNMIFEPKVIDAAISAYARLCARDASCSARTPDLAATMRAVVHNLPDRWLVFPIDPGKVKVATFLLLKRTGNAALVFDAVLAAEHGDPSGLLLLQLLYDLEVPATWPAWGDFYAKSGIDYDPARDYTADMNPPDSIMGSPFSLLVWGGDLGWPLAQAPAAFRQVHDSDVETLLVVGSLDTRFPPEYVTTELLPHLTRARQVVVAEAGHELFDVQPKALERLLAGFFDTGAVDVSLYAYAPVSFQVSPGAPVLAKLALGVGAFVVAAAAAAIAAVWLLLRRVRRRRLPPHEQAV